MATYEILNDSSNTAQEQTLSWSPVAPCDRHNAALSDDR